MRLKCIIVSLVLSCSCVFAGDWQQWRGPYSNGSSDERSLVSDLNGEGNTLWVCDLPGAGAGTPIVSNGRVFVSSTDRDSDKLLGICIDEKTGKILWEKKLGTAGQKLPRNNMASSSPAADGKMVYFIFDSGELTGLDHSGELLWSRNLSKDHGSVSIKYGYSSTPLIYKGRMYVQVLRRPESYRGPKRDDLDSLLLVIDPKNGETLFRLVRSTNAEGESCDAYSSPIPVEFNGRSEIVIVGGDLVTGHLPSNGKELWRYGTNPEFRARQRLIPSVTVGGGIVYAAQSRSGDLYAIKPGGKGRITDAQLKWKFTGNTTDSPTPLYYKGNVYTLDGTSKKMLRCIDAGTGGLKWEGKLGGRDSYYASPTAADGKIYCINEAGKAVVVVAGGDEMRVISTREFGDGVSRSSIAIANGRIFIRTAKKLYCIGKR